MRQSRDIDLVSFFRDSRNRRSWIECLCEYVIVCPYRVVVQHPPLIGITCCEPIIKPWSTKAGLVVLHRGIEGLGLLEEYEYECTTIVLIMTFGSLQQTSVMMGSEPSYVQARIRPRVNHAVYFWFLVAHLVYLFLSLSLFYDERDRLLPKRYQ